MWNLPSFNRKESPFTSIISKLSTAWSFYFFPLKERCYTFAFKVHDIVPNYTSLLKGTVRNCFIAMWKLERGEARDVLKSALPRLPITCFDSVFSDKDYVVVWRIFGQVPSSLRSEIRTYSLHPPKKYADGKTAEVRSIISFEIATPLAAEYKDGLFVFTSKHLGPIIT